jgi:superfamily II DNA or RNA helicase
MFLPSFNGIPKPEVFLNKFKSKSGIVYYCHSGLWKTIYDWCEGNGIEVGGVDDKFKYNDFDLSLDQFTIYINKWDLNIQPREYQIKAAWLILKYRQSLSQLATRAGKTLIAYIVFRYMLENGCKKILMVVPSIQLVKQGVEDFKEYKEFFQSETVWAKSEYCESANLTIGTFQSLVQRADKKNKKYNPNFFKDYDLVCIDESHHLVCKSINTILNQDFMKDVKLKFGFTGTLPKEHTIESFCCHSLMGPTIQDLTTKELIDDGYLAEPIITQIRINYNEDSLLDDYIKCGEYLCSSDKLVDKKKILLPKDQREFTMQYEKVLPHTLKQLKPLYEKKEYMSYLVDLCKSKGSNLLMLEQMLVHRSKKRLDIIERILKDINKNCIIFAHHSEYISYLEGVLKKRFPDKIIYTIKGSTNLKKRQQILDKMLENDNVILVASYGCCGTGLTFKNVDYCIFAQSFKSEIIVKQSLGRMLLKTKEKSQAYIYDLVDCFPTKRLYLQGLAKVKIYKNEGYDYNIKVI